jgi:hypothetical protein
LQRRRTSQAKEVGNIDTVIRYNISVNDGLHTFNITGPCQNTQICNNVLYVGKKQVVTAVSGGSSGDAWPEDTRFINNIFYVDKGGSAGFDLGGMTTVLFDHNKYWCFPDSMNKFRYVPPYVVCFVGIYNPARADGMRRCGLLVTMSSIQSRQYCLSCESALP